MMFSRQPKTNPKRTQFQTFRWESIIYEKNAKRTQFTKRLNKRKLFYNKILRKYTPFQTLAKRTQFKPNLRKKKLVATKPLAKAKRTQFRPLQILPTNYRCTQCAILSIFSTFCLNLSSILRENSRLYRISTCFGISVRYLLLIITVIYSDFITWDYLRKKSVCYC